MNEAEAITNSYAAYVNADYDIAPGLTLNGGLRYTYEKKSGEYLVIATPALSYDFDDLRRKDKNLSWIGSLTYKINPNLTAYATASRGFKSGGFNLDTISATGLVASDLIFAPESVTNYEIGLKGSLIDNALRFSLSAFRMDYSDKQVAQLISTSASPLTSVQITNAGKARIEGFEAEATLRPISGLTLTASASYLDTKYTKFDYGALSFAGNRIEFAPDWMAGLQAEYRTDVGQGEVFAVGSVNYMGNLFLQANNQAAFYEPGYSLFNARLGYETGPIMIALWGKNLTQKEYRTYARVFTGLDQAVYGEPRTYGIEVRYKF